MERRELWTFVPTIFTRFSKTPPRGWQNHSPWPTPFNGSHNDIHFTRWLAAQTQGHYISMQRTENPLSTTALHSEQVGPKFVVIGLRVRNKLFPSSVSTLLSSNFSKEICDGWLLKSGLKTNPPSFLHHRWIFVFLFGSNVYWCLLLKVWKSSAHKFVEFYWQNISTSRILNGKLLYCSGFLASLMKVKNFDIQILKVLTI